MIPQWKISHSAIQAASQGNNKDEFYQNMAQMAKDKLNLPMQIDSETILVDLNYTPGIHAFVYKYKVTTKQSNFTAFEWTQINAMLKIQAINTILKGQGQMRKLLDLDMNVKCIYMSPNNVELIVFVITKKDIY
jgi:hypothetical protein